MKTKVLKNRMASAIETDDYFDSECDSSNQSDTDGNSDVESDCQVYEKEPCKFYNKGGCRDGERCPYLHVCKFALKGNCRYGSNCKLNHSTDGAASSGARSRVSRQDTEERTDPKLADGRYYQWQLNDGNGWLDIDNDHIIEAQYSLPHTKSIKIYNTAYGAVSIDLNRLRVYGKSLKVRRLDDGNTVWVWYCTLRRQWVKYGDTDSKGKSTPVKSSDIEGKFQSDPKGVFTFTVSADTFEIKFRDMRQVSNNKKRKVTRRPEYRQQPAAARASQAASALQNLSVGTKPKWQFQGDSGAWHDYKHRTGTRTECSVNNEEIERRYQQNPHSSMAFKVKGDHYKLDFGAMTQTNLKTKNTRKIRRVLV